MDTGIIIGIIGVVLTVAGFFFAKTIRKTNNKININKSNLKDSNIVFGSQTNNINVKRDDK